MEGPPPLPNTDRLRTELVKRDVDPSEVHVELVLRGSSPSTNRIA